MEREDGGGIGMGNTCNPMAVSFKCMTKSTTNKKKKRIKAQPKGKEKECLSHNNSLSHMFALHDFYHLCFSLQ